MGLADSQEEESEDRGKVEAAAWVCAFTFVLLALTCIQQVNMEQLSRFTEVVRNFRVSRTADCHSRKSIKTES